MNSAKHFKATENWTAFVGIIAIICMPFIAYGLIFNLWVLAITIVCSAVPIVVCIYRVFWLCPKCNKRGCNGAMTRKSTTIKIMKHYRVTYTCNKCGRENHYDSREYIGNGI